MNKLNKLITKYIEDAIELKPKEDIISPEEIGIIKDKLIAAQTEEIVDEILAQYGEEVKLKVQEDERKKIAKKSAENQIKQVRSLIIEGVIIAFIVGIAVNQITDIISILKNGAGHAVIISFIIMLIAVGLLAIIIMYNIAKTIRSFMKEFKDD